MSDKTSNVVQIPNEESQASKDAVEVLESLLAEAKEGVLIGVVGVAVYRGNDYAHFGSELIDKHRVMGMLLEAAVVRGNE